MRTYAKVVTSEAEYMREIQKLIELGYKAAGYGTDYARFVLGSKEIRIVRCYKCR